MKIPKAEEVQGRLNRCRARGWHSMVHCKEERDPISALNNHLYFCACCWSECKIKWVDSDGVFLKRFRYIEDREKVEQKRDKR